MKLTLRHYASIATLAVAGSSFASADLDMCLSADAENPTNFTGSQVGAIGTTFKLYIWIRSLNNVSYSGFEASVGVSTATASGTSAAAQDNKVRFAAGNGAGSWDSLPSPLGMLPVYDNTGLRAQGAAGTVRPWGASFPASTSPPSARVNLTSAWFRLLCIEFRNTGIGAGESYTVKIWDGGSGNSRTSLGTIGTGGVARPGTCEYRLTAVPEPATMAALGLGAVALIRRRRKA